MDPTPDPLPDAVPEPECALLGGLGTVAGVTAWVSAEGPNVVGTAGTTNGLPGAFCPVPKKGVLAAARGLDPSMPPVSPFNLGRGVEGTDDVRTRCAAPSSPA